MQWFRAQNRHQSVVAAARVVLIATFLLAIGSQAAGGMAPWFVASASGLVAALAMGIVLSSEKQDRRIRWSHVLDTHRTMIVFWIIFAVAAIARIVAMPHGTLYVDSFYHLFAAENLLHGLDPQYMRALLYSALVAVTGIFGGFHTTAVMLMNIAINLTTLVVLFTLTRKLFSNAIALCASILFAISPWSILMAHYIRMYDLLQLVVLLGIAAVYRFLAEDSVRRLHEQGIVYLRRAVLGFAVTGAVLALAFHVHVLSATVWLVCAAMVAGVACFRLGNAVYRRAWLAMLRDRFVLFTVLAVVGFILLFFLKPSLIGQLLAGFESELPIGQLLSHDRNYIPFLLEQFPAGLVGFFAGIAVAVSVAKFTRAPQYLFFVVLFFGLIFEILLFKRYFSPRYAYHLFPLYVLVLGIGVAQFVHMLTQMLTTSVRGVVNKRMRLTVLCTAGVIAALVPYANIHRAYTASPTGENQVYEIAYPYQELIRRIRIKPTDYLFSFNYGIWETLQETSAHILPVIVEDMSGTLRPKEHIVNAFATQLSRASHGWFIADVYRLKKWECADPAVEPCVVRQFIQDAFTLKPKHTIDNLSLYEWTAHFPTSVQVASEQPTVPIVGGNMLYNTAWLDIVTPETAPKKETITVTHVVRSLPNNSAGAFMVIHPTASRTDGTTIAFNPQVLFVPAYDAATDAMTYRFNYAHPNGFTIAAEELQNITATVTIFDIATQQLLRDGESMTLYSR